MKIISLKHSLLFALSCILLSAATLAPVMALPLTEVEPNDTGAGAIPLLPGYSGFGAISNGPDSDNWILPFVHTGDQVFTYVSVNTDPTGGDSILQLFYNNGLSAAYNDDGGPPCQACGFKSSVIFGLNSKYEGPIRAKVDGFGSGTVNPYELWQIVVRPNEFSTEVEPNNSSGQATPITGPAFNANAGVDDDYYSFFANAGEKIVVFVNNNPVDENPADPAIDPVANITTDILGVDGNSVLNSNLTTSVNVLGPVIAPATGTFFARVHKVDGADLPYSIVVLVDGATPEVGACCTGTTCTQKSSTNCFTNFFGTGIACGGDIDGDVFPNACDNCPRNANPGQEDNDADGVGNICDGCESDALKTAPGQCGCGVPDTDSDGDGTANCVDACPSDSGKTQPLVCGCGVADVDLNANGVLDCQAGPDLKAILGKAVSQINKFKINSKAKTKSLKAMVAQIKDKVATAGAAVVLLDASFNLNTKTASLVKALNALIKANSENLKQKKGSANKAAKAIIAAIA